MLITFPVLVTGNPSHTIKVTKSGYNDWQQSYLGNRAAGGDHFGACRPGLHPSHATYHNGRGRERVLFHLVSSISGTVHFDGSYKGTTPVSVEVASLRNARAYCHHLSLRGRELEHEAFPATLPPARPSR